MMMYLFGGIAYRGATAMRVRPSLALSQSGTVAMGIVNTKGISVATRDGGSFAASASWLGTQFGDNPHIKGGNRLLADVQGTANGRNGCWSRCGGEAR
jgi:hypothetical protein